MTTPTPQVPQGALDPDALVADLTDAQRQAVEHVDGPLLVLAAAGSGKTRVITRRIARMVALGVPPWSILALTFTNKAAGEMRERVRSLVGGEDRHLRGMTVSTFHSLCARLLRRYADSDALPRIRPEFSIYGSGDQQALMKRVVTELGLSTTNWPPRSVLATISNAKNELLDAEGYAARAGDYYTKQVSKVFSAYERALRDAGAVDFDDLLVLTARLLQRDAGVRGECQHRWRYLLIDEYQDTNHAQFVIASLIAGEGEAAPSGAGEQGDRAGPNICVVGDPDQSIYGWRGADISNILEFEEHYPSARVIPLGENFRSTAPILATADALIRHNQRRKHKPLYTRDEGGEPVSVVLCRDERHEAELVADWLRRLREESELSDARPLRWADMAIFYRNNALSRVLEDALRERGVPYVIARGTAFYDREEIKNALSYLRVIANPADEVSLARIINTPTRGLGKTTIERLGAFAADEGIGLMEALRRARETEGLTARAQNAAEKFVRTLDDLTGSGSFMGAELTGSLADLVERVIKQTGLERMYQAQAEAGKAESDIDRLENLSELVSSAAQFEAEYTPEDDPFAFPGADALAEGGGVEVPPLLAMLRAFLESVALVADADKVDPSQGTVTLMTLHAAKGLEFPVAAMVGLEDGILPSSRAFDSEQSLEEERRLCFVGVTRAMRKLQLSSARYRTIRGMTERAIPSRFLEELDPQHVRTSDRSDELSQLDDEGSSGTGGAAWGGGVGDPPARRRGSVGAVARARERFPAGCTVRHPQFGVGTVLEVSGGAMPKARVRFREAGEKTLILEYARLARLD